MLTSVLIIISYFDYHLLRIKKDHNCSVPIGIFSQFHKKRNHFETILSMSTIMALFYIQKR